MRVHESISIEAGGSPGSRGSAREREVLLVLLEEELLASITSLHELYARTEDVNLTEFWQQMAEAAEVRTTIEIDAAQTKAAKAERKARAQIEQGGEPAGNSEVLDDLLAAEEDLLREIREAELGREHN